MPSGLGDLAREYPRALIQSHISESHDAVDFSLALHPEADGRDIQLFDEAGLLTNQVRYTDTCSRRRGSASFIALFGGKNIILKGEL